MDTKTCVRRAALLILLTLTAILSSACGILPEEEETLAPPLVQPKREEYELYKVVKKDITKYVKGVGTLVPVVEKHLFFRESGKRLKSIDIKYGQKVEKGTIVAKVDSGNLESRIKQQEIAVRKAEFQLDQLREQYNKYLSLPPEYQPTQKELEGMKGDIKLAEMDLESARIVLNDLKSEYEQSILVAPIDGQVTFIENLKEGDPVEAYSTVVTIADPQKLQVYYQSDNTRLVKTGMKADVIYNNKEYKGEVVLSPDNVPADAHEKYKNAIVVKAEGFPEDIKMGEIVDISIPIESRKNTIVIPKKGLQRIFTESFVRVMDGDSKKEIDVEVGIETPTEVEILSGIEEGQMVILN